MIDDVIKPVQISASVTTQCENGDIIAKDDDNYTINNNIWDGQSLADMSLFDDEESTGRKGMMLLRNSFFKSCAFNTNIQKWFDDAFGDSKPEFLKDMFGREVKLADIKLITTPSSLKFLKFVGKFDGNNKEERKQSCYEKWLEVMSDVFGVCKSESSSPFGESHQLSYQIVNSLPLNKDEIGKITKNADGSYSYGGLLMDDLKHIENLNNDVDYFKSKIKTKNPLPSDALMLKLLEVNNAMWYTQLVKDYVKDMVDDYKENLRKGRIKVKGSDYAVLFGNPLEMLQFATFGEIRNNPLIKKQLYCRRYENGAMLAGFRNPHITIGNVLVAENVHREEFDTYFNLSDNIVISNAYDNDIMERLQGQDYDSDTLLLSSDPILVKAAAACQNSNFRVPINGIEGENTERNFKPSDEADLDYNTAANKIGEIVNLSQILNSYYWHYNSMNDNGQYDGLHKEIYTQTSILSSLSQIEIDRAKKDYGTDTNQHLKKLREHEYNGELLLKKAERKFTKNDLADEEIGQIRSLEKQHEIAKRRKENQEYIVPIKEAIKTLYDSTVQFEVQEKILQKLQKDLGMLYILTVSNPKKCIGKIKQWINTLSNSDLKYDEKVKILHEIEADLNNEIPLYSHNDANDEIKRIAQEKSDLINSDEKQVQVRPVFFKYCGVGTRYAFEPFNTPMDYLQEVIDKIPARNRTKTIDITTIIPKSDFRKADNYQLQRIVGFCEKASKKIKALQSNQHMPGEIRYSRVRQVYDDVIQDLIKWKINDNTIRVVLYRAFSEKGGKYYDEKYSEMRRFLASCLYQAHPGKFMQVIKMSKENTHDK